MEIFRFLGNMDDFGNPAENWHRVSLCQLQGCMKKRYDWTHGKINSQKVPLKGWAYQNLGWDDDEDDSEGRLKI